MFEFDEDAYREKELNRYLDGNHGVLSNCCEANFIEDTDICSECMEHAVTLLEDYENYLCDKADADRELRREND